jgi:hypothetical protein
MKDITMETKLKPPDSDNEVDRHKFYTAITIFLGINQNATETIGKKLDTLTDSYDTVHDIINASETRNKTMISGAVFLWAVISGMAGWYVERTVANFDKFMARFDVVERKMQTWEPELDKIKDLPEKQAALARRIEDMQRQLFELEQDKDKSPSKKK